MAFLALFLTVLSVFHGTKSFSLPTRQYNTPKLVSSAYYAGWHAAKGFPISAISWDKYNILTYAFAVTTPDVNNLSLDLPDLLLLPEFVTQAHKNDVAAHVGVGGWSGSRWFSSNLATGENRTAFVKTIVDFAEKYHLDGINFDWEYPNKQSIGCNLLSPNDTANFLAFLQELRANTIRANMTLSATTSLTPFLDASGRPSKDVSGFAEVLDYILLMNYDVWDTWSSGVGPNAPLNDTCADPANQQGSAVSAVKAWTEAGMPANQIVLAVASYGHSFTVSSSDAFENDSKDTLAPYPKFNAKRQPPGGSWDNVGGVDVCGVSQGPGGTYELWGLVEAGFLTETGEPASGIRYRYDECSQTPFVYNETSQVMVSFDDVKSFAAKGSYIKNTGLRGFALWEAGGDYDDLLLDSIRVAAGHCSE